MHFWRPLSLATLLALVAFPNSAFGLHSYWIPMQWGMQDNVAPIKPLPPVPRQVLVWNTFDEGPYGARLFEFEEVGETGSFRRLPQRRLNLLTTFNTTNDQERCDQLLSNAVTNRIDSTSFHDMGGIDYFPREAGAFEKHIESARRLQSDAYVYFESTSWLTVAEAKEHFGGTIPWTRVVEVLAEPGFTLDQVKEQAEQRGDLKIRLRRATLRLVAGQFLSMRPMRPLNDDLPLEHDSASPHLRHNGQTPFRFELGRASQMRGLNGEAELLVPFALATANHQRELFRPFPSDWESMPPETVGIHVLSLDRAHTLLFRRRLGMTIANEVNGHAVLSGTLDQMVEKQKPRSRLASLAAIHAAVPGRYSELGAMGVLRNYRETFRRDLDFRDYTVRGPLILRDYSPLFDFTLRAMLAPSWKPITDGDYQKLRAALDEAGQLPSVRNFAHNRDDVGQRDWQKEFGLAPLVLSNFDGVSAARFPDYLTNVLLALGKNYHPAGLDPKGFDEATLVVATTDPNVIRQALDFGFTKVDDTAYRLPLKAIAAFANAHPELAKKADERGPLRRGVWYKAQLMTELYGM